MQEGIKAFSAAKRKWLRRQRRETLIAGGHAVMVGDKFYRAEITVYCPTCERPECCLTRRPE